jgi:hypothetical protein
MLKINNIIPIVLIIIFLIFTRFVDLTWGFPYLFHPDERNIVVSLEQLNCISILDLKNCLNPNFFAYGQFFIYLGYIFTFTQKNLSFTDLTLILRSISAVFSVFTVTVGALMMKELIDKKIRKYQERLILIAISLVLIFSPGLIQISHFGTTESMLTFFYTTLIYISILFMRKKLIVVKYLIMASLIVGLAVAVKASSLIFLVIPMLAMLMSDHISLKNKALNILHISFLTMLVSIFFSPHYLISSREFLNALSYESAVALGRIKVFYTRQFEDTIPLIFQFSKIFPYSLGMPAMVLFIFGVLFLPKNRENSFLLFSFLAYFIPTAFIYAKWTRFMAPVLPLMLIISVLFLVYLFILKTKNKLFGLIFFCITVLIICTPGVSFTQLYLNEDIRITASEWIINNVPSESVILSETANVVDIPVGDRLGNNYEIISFNLYDIDEDEQLYSHLLGEIKRADYILVPSRRIFANHDKNNYPKVAKYYKDLFEGNLGFEKVAEFKVLDDESAEETFSVFDHPVIRIYKRI